MIDLLSIESTGFVTNSRIIIKVDSNIMLNWRPSNTPQLSDLRACLAASQLPARVRLGWAMVFFSWEGNLCMSAQKKLQCFPERFWPNVLWIHCRCSLGELVSGDIDEAFENSCFHKVARLQSFPELVFILKKFKGR